MDPPAAPRTVKAREAWINCPRPFLASTVSNGRITAETKASWHKMAPVAAAPNPKNLKVDIFKKVEFSEKIKLSERPSTGSGGTDVITLAYSLPGGAIALQAVDTR